MRKFISAVTSLAITATMATAFVPATSMAAAQDASKGLSLEAFAEADSKYSAMGSNITVSAADIAAGDVTIPCALYLDEVNHSQTIAATWSVNGGADAANITFKAYDPNNDYWASDKNYTIASGASFSTKQYVGFAGAYDDFEESYMNHGTYNITCVKGMKFANIDNYYMCVGWTNGGYDYEYTGEKSDSHPVAVFDVTLPKGTAAGDYTLDFTSYNTSGNPNQVNPATMIETTGRYTEALGNLDLQSLKITVEGGSTPVDKTTTTTTKKPDDVTTTTVKQPVADGDIIFDFGNYEAKPGDTVKVAVTITPNGKPVAGVDAVLKHDAPLELTNIGGKTAAFGNKAVQSNLAESAFNVITLGGEKNDTPMVAEDGAQFILLGYKVPENCPDGKYEIGFGDKCMVFMDNSKNTYSVTKLNGFITVGDGETPADTTTTTKKPDDVTTTTVKQPVADGDIIFDFGNYEAKPGDTVKVAVTITPNGKPIAGVDAVLKHDAPLELTNIGGKTAAFGNKAVQSNLAECAFNVITLGGEKNDTPMVAEDGAQFILLGYKVPENCPDGKYEIGFGDKCMVFMDNSKNTYSVTKLNGFITVGDGSTPDDTTTTTTKKPDDVTTTTTVPGPQPGDGEYAPVWGDTNCDGKVNVADVVVLNKWLHDSASIQITDQGKVNADCCDPQDANGGKVKVSGVKLTAADSDSIIKSIVSLVTLPVSSK